jgi:lysyl-tRNA synthetase class 2
MVSWQPTSSIDTLKARASFLTKIRQFFAKRDYLEVETPYLANYGVTDVHLSNIKAYFRSQAYYLQTSPEYHMKRLLAAGSGPIYQLARVFRDDEYGRWHNPEFSLLEWYQLDVDHHYLIAEIEALFKTLGHDVPNFSYLSYQQAFLKACEVDPLHATIEELQHVCSRYDLAYVLSKDEPYDQYLHLLMAMVVEPYLAKHFQEPVVIYDFPASQACLAQVEGPVAHRFEVYWQGVELANGFHELTDPRLQAERFASDLAMRSQMGLEPMAMDTQFLQALEAGMPACSGVALGLDRLFALLLEKPSIADVMSFSFPNV